MPDTIRSLFSLSSPYHLYWFVCSMAMLGVSIVAAARGSRALIGYFCFFHAMVTIEVPFVLFFFNYNGPVFSVHCIWFNALVALIHFALFRVATASARNK